jgi:beta-phosphoglucomutase-like phosphatase (HAD superfamily)
VERNGQGRVTAHKRPHRTFGICQITKYAPVVISFPLLVILTCFCVDIVMGAVTNAPKENAEFLIDSLGLDRFFQFLILGDECTRAKPYPDPYWEGLKRAGVTAAEAVVFEDSPTGVRAGAAAKVLTVGIASSQPEEILLGEGAAIVVSDFSTITLAYLDQLLGSQ